MSARERWQVGGAVPMEMFAHLRRYADRYGCSMSEAMRRFLAFGIAYESEHRL